MSTLRLCFQVSKTARLIEIRALIFQKVYKNYDKKYIEDKQKQFKLLKYQGKKGKVNELKYRFANTMVKLPNTQVYDQLFYEIVFNCKLNASNRK